jgi:hypothetical protein
MEGQMWTASIAALLAPARGVTLGLSFRVIPLQCLCQARRQLLQYHFFHTIFRTFQYADLVLAERQDVKMPAVLEHLENGLEMELISQRQGFFKNDWNLIILKEARRHKEGKPGALLPECALLPQ